MSIQEFSTLVEASESRLFRTLRKLKGCETEELAKMRSDWVPWPHRD